MSYVIIKTDGTILTTITDGTINTTSTSLGLPGRLYPGYGQVVDTNFVHVVENFADIAPPVNPLQGQLWYDTSNATPGSTGVLRICPADGEANALNWYTVATSAGTADLSAANITASGNVDANNFNAANTVTANLVDTDYLTVNIQANIANANVSGNATVANLTTGNITTGSSSTLGNITGAYTVLGSATLDGKAGTTIWINGGNLLATGVKTDNWYYSNGTAVSFDGTYSNSNVSSYLPTYSGAVGAFGGGATFNGNTLSAGANTSNGTITGNWTLSPGSLINGLSNISGSNIVGAVASATSATTAATVTSPIQSNITQLGTLTSLTTSGLATAQRLSATVATGTAPLVIQSTTTVANLSADLLDGYDTDTSASPSSVVVRDSSGNVSANYFIGNGAFLTGLSTGSLSQITNGTSNVAVVSSGGNVAITIGGIANGAVFSSQGLSVTANVNANNVTANRLAGSLTTAAQPNVTSLGTLSYLDVSGNINAPNILITTGAFYGNASGLSSIPGANVLGTVPIANYATYSGIITIGSQPNITSTGTLTFVNSSGNITGANVIANGAFYGSGAGLTNIPAANLSGSVPSATTAGTAGTVTTAAQPNITSVSASFGNLTLAANNAINMSGSISQIFGPNLVSANFFQGNGSRLSSINGANVTGTVANASFATTAGTISSIPAGTRMIFAQTSAPTGWTKQTASDNAALRVVSGAAGTGGSVNFTAAFTSQTVAGTVGSTSVSGTVGDTAAGGTVGDTALTTAQLPAHTHYVATNTFVNSSTAAPFGPSYYLARETNIGGDTEYNLQATYSAPDSLQSSSTGLGSTHTHTFAGTAHNHSFSSPAHSHTFSGTSINLAVKYVDVIIAQKD